MELGFTAVGIGGLFGVEPQVAFALRLIRSVAGEARVGENGANVAVEFDIFRLLRS